MGRDVYAILETTSELEKKLAEHNALPQDSEEKEAALLNLIWYREDDINVCTYNSAMDDLECFFNNEEKYVIPKSIHAEVETFVANVPPFVFWNASQFEKVQKFGRTYPAFENLEIGIWFLGEKDVQQLKELSRFVPELEADHKQWSLDNSVPAPALFLAEWLLEKRRLTNSRRLTDLFNLTCYINLWIDVLDQAIEKNTGLLLYAS